MATGLDYAFIPHPSPSAIKAYGATFACRYTSPQSANDANGKNLQPAEAAALLSAGIAVVVVFEDWSASRMLAGHDAGAADALHSDAVVRALGMPGLPVYFACDFDATEANQVPINAYLDGAASVIGRSRTGIYGGYYPLKRAWDAGKVTWGWQAYAWSGGQWDPRAQLRQVQNGISVGGASCDLDHSMTADYGQWPRPAQEEDMPLTAEDVALIWGQKYLEYIDDSGDGRTVRTCSDILFSAQAYGVRNGQALAALTAQVAAIQAKIGDPVDEAALAAALAPVIQSAISAAGQADAQQIAAAVAAAFAAKLGA